MGVIADGASVDIQDAATRGLRTGGRGKDRTGGFSRISGKIHETPPLGAVRVGTSSVEKVDRNVCSLMAQCHVPLFGMLGDKGVVEHDVAPGRVATASSRLEAE